MPNHPANIGGGPKDFARLDAEEMLHRPDKRNHMATIVAHHALRLAGGSRRVENVERIGRQDRGTGDINAPLFCRSNGCGEIDIPDSKQIGLQRLPLENKAGEPAYAD